MKRPGVRLQRRPGYFDEDPAPTAPPRVDRFLASVVSPVDARTLPLDARVSPGTKPNTLAIRLKIAPSGTAAGETARFRILFVQKEATGRQFRGIDDSVEFNLRELSEGITYPSEIERLPEAAELRIVVENRTTGAIGSLTIPYRDLRLP